MCRHITAEQQREGWRAVKDLVRGAFAGGVKPIVRGLAAARRRKAALKAAG